ncbi:endonuclease/exonuclease/phosphatase family protein [Actinoplanes sp. NPDC049118]|uniref:endonuclease/exonuclease/phosphatase family protein n=1 Tax=Actinoplanes sp. NPDC049118 TaxID=3155769 RepID=UPI0033C04D0C
MITVGTWNLENLFWPDDEFGPDDKAVYDGKLAALAATINAAGPDVLGLQEVGQPEALADLVALLDGDWHTVLSTRFEPRRPIRVGVISRHPLQVVTDTAVFAPLLRPVQGGDEPRKTVSGMGRGVLGVDVDLPGGQRVTMLVCHLKSKLLSFPGPNGASRFSPRNEAERARYAAYALYRRTAEAVTVRVAVDDLLHGAGQRPLVLVGDLNDEPSAATTQILYGPPGSQLGTAGFSRPDRGDDSRLWSLAPLIPEETRFSRVYQGRPELIDHILVSHALLDRVREVRTVTDRRLPSVGDDPAERRSAPDSDHAPIFATIDV